MSGYPAAEKKYRSIAFRTRVVHFKLELPGQLSSWKRENAWTFFPAIVPGWLHLFQFIEERRTTSS
jgi:hypothetical protein